MKTGAHFMLKLFFINSIFELLYCLKHAQFLMNF